MLYNCRFNHISPFLKVAVKTNQIKRPDPGGKAECSSSSKPEGSNWDVQ